MKINRYRKVHRILQFYSNNFGFRKPYQVLIDGTICVAALKHQINISEQFSKYLDGDVKLLTTQCIITEAEKLGSATFGALLILKKFGIHRCGHGKSPVLASDCILHMVGESNSSRYIVATQDLEVQQACCKKAGVPLLYLHLRAPTLARPSSSTQAVANEKSLKNFQINGLDKEKLAKLNEGNQNVEDVVKRKRKRKGGPNPLSCKKKKKKIEESGKGKHLNPRKKKRKRKKNRLVKKIKNELMASLTS